MFPTSGPLLGAAGPGDPVRCYGGRRAAGEVPGAPRERPAGGAGLQ